MNSIGPEIFQIIKFGEKRYEFQVYVTYLGHSIIIYFSIHFPLHCLADTLK